MATETIDIKTKTKESCWVALDINNNVICEGKTPEEVEEEAKKKTEVFFLMFVPKEGIYFY